MLQPFTVMLVMFSGVAAPPGAVSPEQTALPGPSGACCLPDTTCLVADRATCHATGGVYQGHATGCATVTCPPLTGCCFFDGTCRLSTERACVEGGGVPLGAGSTCDGAACFATPQGPPSSTTKGSLLVFSKIELRWDVAGNLVQDTFISITNDHPHDVRVQMYFVNGDPPLAAQPPPGEPEHPGWNWVDNTITLSGNQPVYFSALSGRPAGVSPFTILDPALPRGRPATDGTSDRVLRGFLVAWAVDADGMDEIRWNHLAGEVMLVNYRDASASQYNALAYATADPQVPHGAATGTPGTLALDGQEYAAPPELLTFDFLASGTAALSNGRVVTSETEIVLHPASIDLRQETSGPIATSATFHVWNMNEVKFSGTTRCITVWAGTPLRLLAAPNHFLLEHLQTDHGKARVDGLASSPCDLDLDGDELIDHASEPSPLLGLVVKRLLFDGGVNIGAGVSSMTGMGSETAQIRFDPLAPPPEATRP